MHVVAHRLEIAVAAPSLKEARDNCGIGYPAGTGATALVCGGRCCVIVDQRQFKNKGGTFAQALAVRNQ